MNISMNGMRINLARAYNTLAKDFLDPNSNRLANDIETLRETIGAFLCCYEPNNPDFKELDIELIDVQNQDEND